ncbi:MAG: hypothetical protein HOV94_14550, partial [Saccharothrix sp.]|nr:hypothetical protein [Saccharothrix sp.]
MVHTIPLALPVDFVVKYAIDLAAGSSDGWVVKHVGAQYGPAGDLYVLTRLWRYKKNGEEAEDPVDQSVSAWVVARHPADGDGTPASSAVFRTPTRYSKFGDCSDLRLAVLPDGAVVLSGTPDATHLFDAALTRVLASYTTEPSWSPNRTRDLGDPFATGITVTPGARLLCVVAEYGLRDLSRLAPNLVALTDEALTAERRPQLRAVTALGAVRIPTPSDLGAAPYVTYPEDAGTEPWPAVSLRESVEKLSPPRFGHRGRWLGHPVALS